MTVEYRPGEDELINYRAYRRKRTEAYDNKGRGPTGIAYAKSNPIHMKEIGKLINSDKFKGNTSSLINHVKKHYPDLHNHPNVQAAYKKHAETNESTEDSNRLTLDEVLSISARRKKGRDARRRKTQLKRARKMARRKMARDPVLKKRSRRSARADAAKKLLKGKNKSDMSDAIKASIERRLDSKSFQNRIALKQKRLMPVKRREEIRRKKGH